MREREETCYELGLFYVIISRVLVYSVYISDEERRISDEKSLQQMIGRVSRGQVFITGVFQDFLCAVECSVSGCCGAVML